MKTRSYLLVPVAAAAVLLAGCGSSAKTASAPAAAPTTSTSTAPEPTMSMSMGPAAGSPSDATSAVPVVHIKNFSFSDPSKPITAGEMFQVVDDDSVAHTYEDVKGAFDSGNIPGGGSKMVKAPAAGTYQLKCDYHPSMHGSLTITA